MRQHHFAGERAFVDYAGDTLEVVDGASGQVHRAQFFVGVLGASNYTYVEATWSQTLPDWIGAHFRMLAFFGGAPGQLVSDNLKAGVTKACFYEAKGNQTYADLAAHSDTAILPARPYRPRHRAKVEVGVQLVQRWIVARLRGRRFFSLTELNAAIRELLDRFNGKVTRHLGASRRELFEQLDRPALKPLPAAPCEYAEWLERKVGLDYHVEVGKHDSSVPHQLLRQKLWARVTARTVEIFHEGQRVAAHVKTSGNRQHTTVPEHMPASHRRYAGWTPGEIRREAERIGPSTGDLVDLILTTKTHPELGFRACLGIVRLARPHGRDALEAACRRAGDRRHVLQLGRLDPEEQPASPPTRDVRGGADDIPSQHPRARVSPLRRKTCSIILPTTCCALSCSTAWPTPSPNCRAATTSPISAMPNGWDS
jgi:transposase